MYRGTYKMINIFGFIMSVREDVSECHGVAKFHHERMNESTERLPNFIRVTCANTNIQCVFS